MKILLLLVAAAGTVAVAGCASTVRGARNLNPFTASTSFQHWDINGDGVISQSEADKYGPLKSNFQRIDTNGNGVIDGSEYTAATSDLSAQPGFDAYDLNGDGVITEQEADKAPRGGISDIFDDVDADGDGNISRTEFQAATVNLIGGIPFNELDLDNDGVVDGSEAKASAPVLWQKFDQVDLNGDGHISKQEYQSFQSRRQNGDHQNSRDRNNNNGNNPRNQNRNNNQRNDNNNNRSGNQRR